MSHFQRVINRISRFHKRIPSGKTTSCLTSTPRLQSASVNANDKSTDRRSNTYTPSSHIPKYPGSIIYLTLADFQFEQTLGTGTFGRVHLGRAQHSLSLLHLFTLLFQPVQRKEAGTFYAIKVLSKARVLRLNQVEHTNNEAQILRLIDHPFIIKLYNGFQDNSNLYMLIEFVPGGELFTLLARCHVSSQSPVSYPRLLTDTAQRHSLSQWPNSTHLKWH